MSQQEVSAQLDDGLDTTTTTATTTNAEDKLIKNIELQGKSSSSSSSTMIHVKDYAYDEDEDLHYGVGNHSQYLTDEEEEDINDDYDEEYDDDEYQDHHHSFYQGGNSAKARGPITRDSIINIPKNYYFEDGPPWKEDPDLKTPLIKDDSKNEYEFSISSSDEIHGKAIALFDFSPEHDNEVGLKEGQIIWISYRHGQGWLVAEDSATGETGLVPEQYVQLVNEGDVGEPLGDEPKRFLPNIIGDEHIDGHESDWVDEEEEEEEEEEVEGELPNVGKLNVS